MAIQHFLAERAHYESTVSAQPGLTPISWAGSIDAIFLRSLLRAHIFGQCYTDINDLTDVNQEPLVQPRGREQAGVVR